MPNEELIKNCLRPITIANIIDNVSDTITDYTIINDLGEAEKMGMDGYNASSSDFSTAYHYNRISTTPYSRDLLHPDSLRGGSHKKYHRISPIICLDSKAFYDYSKNHPEVFYKGKKNLLEIGEFPKALTHDSKELEKRFKSGDPTIQETGKDYIVSVDKEGKKIFAKEYQIESEKYVRSEITKHLTSSYDWYKVFPIQWHVLNWGNLPNYINPQGNAKDDFIFITPNESILPYFDFYPLKFIKDNNSSLYQNSTIRGYLNGMNVNLIDINGRLDRIANHGGDFTNNNLFTDLFNITHQQIQPINNSPVDYSLFIRSLSMRYQPRPNNSFSNQKPDSDSDSINKETMDHYRKERDISKLNNNYPNPYGFSYESLSNDELLNAYIKSGTSVFLHGPSGVGKSGRVKQIDPTATRITLRPQMNPEEIDGVLDRATGNYNPPLWYKDLTEKCNNEPNKQHVLFIDELTNVKPTVQSLVYSIVLDRAGKDGLWPLPKNSVVVAAGNESIDNMAAYPLTNALHRRFSHIYYEVNKNDWISWATGVSHVKQQSFEKNEQAQSIQAKVHPSIVAYVASRGDSVLYSDLDEDDPTIVIDPRKWEIASRVLYSTNNPKSLEPAIGKELTEDFSNFVESIPITLDDVIKGNFDEEEMKSMDISQKYATACGLCMANEDQLETVRAFISSNLGEELSTFYDLLWTGNDPERAFIIDEISRKQEVENDEFGENN